RIYSLPHLSSSPPHTITISFLPPTFTKPTTKVTAPLDLAEKPLRRHDLAPSPTSFSSPLTSAASLSHSTTKQWSPVRRRRRKLLLQILHLRRSSSSPKSTMVATKKTKKTHVSINNKLLLF
ncbi:hypothetical protein AABB24_014810, partial [Solanum stoloniferum]